MRGCVGDEAGMLAALGAELAKNEGRVWALGNVPFLSRKAVGTLLCDTGAGVTCVSRSFLERAGLLGDVRAHEGGRRPGVASGSGCVRICLPKTLRS